MKKLIVVTGASRGIGKAIAFKFAATGDFDVVICSRSENNLKDFKSQFGLLFPLVNCITITSDLGNKEAALNFCREVLALKRPIDVLVNNAGVFLPGAVLEEEEGVFEKLINVNLASAYHISRRLVPKMKQAGKGHVFNICSTASIIPYINGGAYCISKFALYGMTKVLREELKTSGIRVTAVLPGATLTDSWAGAELPPERFMKPEDVAESVWSAYALSNTSVVEEILIRPQLGDI